MAIRRRGDPDATDPNQQAAHDLAIRRRCQQLQQQEQECYMCEHLGRPECRPTASFIKIQCCNCYGTIERIPLGMAASLPESWSPVNSRRPESLTRPP